MFPIVSTRNKDGINNQFKKKQLCHMSFNIPSLSVFSSSLKILDFRAAFFVSVVDIEGIRKQKVTTSQLLIDILFIIFM